MFFINSGSMIKKHKLFVLNHVENIIKLVFGIFDNMKMFSRMC